MIYMKKYLNKSIILILIVIMSIFSTSCGISSIFLVFNDLASQIREESTVDETIDLVEENTEVETDTSITAETTTEETTTVAGTTGIENSEYVEVVDSSPAEAVAQNSANLENIEPQTYTEQQATTASILVDSLNPQNAYSAVLVFHDWIIANTQYDFTEPVENIPDSSFSADGVFINKVAVCLGYALAFDALIDEWSSRHPEFGVESVVAYGDNDTSTPSIGHAWNMVKIGGAWYHVDVTWDDNGGSSVYLYFLLPTSIISQSRVTYYVDDFKPVPSANSTSYVFGRKIQGVNTTVILQDISDFSELYLEKILEGNTSVTFFHPSSADLNSLSVTNEVYNELRKLGYNSLIYYNYYNAYDEYDDPPTYSDGTYNNYYFFTIIPQV